MVRNVRSIWQRALPNRAIYPDYRLDTLELIFIIFYI